MTLMISQDGKVLTETQEGATFPADLSFATVNDFVHAHGTQFEDLQYLCLGLASALEKAKAPNHCEHIWHSVPEIEGLVSGPQRAICSICGQFPNPKQKSP